MNPFSLYTAAVGVACYELEKNACRDMTCTPLLSQSVHWSAVSVSDIMLLWFWFGRYYY